MTRVSYSQRVEASLRRMGAHEEQESTTRFGVFLTWSLWPQRTISLPGLTMKIWVMTSTQLLVIPQNESTSVQDVRLRPASATSASLARVLPSPGGHRSDDGGALLDVRERTRRRGRDGACFPSWDAAPRALVARSRLLLP